MPSRKMPDGHMSAVVDIAIVTRAFYRALLAMNDFNTALTPDRDRRTRAAWAQQFFGRQGLMPDVNVVDMADYEAGFGVLLTYRDQLRDQARQGTLTATDADVMDAIRGNSDAMVAINFLKRVFGDFDKAGKFRPAIVESPGVNVMAGPARNKLEACNSLSEAQAVMVALMQEHDRLEREAARKLNEPAPRNVYDSVAVLARPKLTENEYESATSALEDNGNASVVYERLPAPNIDAAHPPPGLVYVSLPPETPGAPPTLLYDQLPPDPAGRFDPFPDDSVATSSGL